MSQTPSEVVFTTHGAMDESCIFAYNQGPLSLKAPQKRGRRKGTPKNGKSKHNQVQRGVPDLQSFDFVNYTGNIKASSNASQKLIRRRGMLLSLREKRQILAKKNNKDTTLRSPLISQPGGVDPFDAAPLKMKPYLCDLLKHCCTSISERLYLVEQKAEFNPIVDFWMPLAFQESALLHAFIAFSGFYTLHSATLDDQPVIFSHLKRAISQANERMADRMISVSTETLVVVALVAIIQSLHGIHGNWEHSMRGLQMLVHTKGVLESLEKKPIVLGMIYRADLIGSINSVQTPFFAKHFGWPSTWNRSPLRSGFTHLQRTLALDERVTSCIGRLDDTIALLRRLNGKSMADVANCRFVITACQYRLLSLGCLNIPNELCRLSLIIYTVAILDERPPKMPAYDHLLWKYHELWDRYDREHAVGLTSEFQLWTLVTTTSVLRTHQITYWCLSESRRALACLGIHTLDALTRIMESFLPICEVRCQEMWHMYQAPCE